MAAATSHQVWGNKMKTANTTNITAKIILSLVIAIITLNSASAAVDVTYNFDQQNVSVFAFNCFDSGCSSVSPFSGSIITGPTVNNGAVVLRYPDSLATQYGYAEFFVSSGYRPLVGKHNWNTLGQPGVASTSQSANFTKVQSVCKATSTPASINIAQVFMPITILTNTQLDSATSNAFRLSTTTGVAYVPPGLLQEFWGADVSVLLEVLDSSNSIVWSSQNNFNSQNNNAVFSDAIIPSNFVFTPQTAGNYVARLTTKVTDNQCPSSQDDIATVPFTVNNIIIPPTNNTNSTNNSINNSTNSSNTNSSNTTQQSNLVVTFNPANNSAFNLTMPASFTLNATSNLNTECKWSLTDIPALNMTNNFSSADGFNHSATINAHLGTNNIFVACDPSQVASTNYDLSFTVQNILLNTSLIGANNLNNSTLSNSTITNSSIINSAINNSTITQSIITNSTIINAIINNANISNNVITSGTIILNNNTYNASSQGSALISRLINSAPVADFSQSVNTLEINNFARFVSTSSDVDINGPLNDSLMYLWNFGDGSNSTASTVEKFYSQKGTFTVRLTVTDRFNLSSVKTSTITVLDVWPTSGSSTKKEKKSSDDNEPIIVAKTVQKTASKPSSRNEDKTAVVAVQQPPVIIKTPTSAKISPNEVFLITALVFFNLIIFGGVIKIFVKILKLYK